MFIEQLDKSKLLITLENEDLNTFDLKPYSISLENRETKALLSQLLTLAAVKAGIQIKDRILSVEAMPYDTGCFLLVTIKPKKKRKLYRIKQEPAYLLAVFADTQKMLEAIKRLYSLGGERYSSTIYSYNGRFYLLISSKMEICKNFFAVMQEYGKVLPCGELTAARLNEYCSPLRSNDSISYIGSRL